VCTLAVALQPGARWPVVVAANRDERLGRPAEDWALRDAPGGVRYAAPRDAVGGGTWIGVGPTGLFAAVTNFHAGPGGPDPSRRSRGELVPLALEQPGLAAARQALAGRPASLYNPFHLLVADRERGFLWWYDGAADGVAELGPGLHVVTERSPWGRCPRGESVRGRWPLDATPARLRELLAAHAPPPATCIHMDPHYGTRSSAVLRLSASLGHSELFASAGAPCVTALEDRAGLLVALSGPA
jgi:hypothetical protein